MFHIYVLFFFSSIADVVSVFTIEILLIECECSLAPLVEKRDKKLANLLAEVKPIFGRNIEIKEEQDKDQMRPKRGLICSTI